MILPNGRTVNPFGKRPFQNGRKSQPRTLQMVESGQKAPKRTRSAGKTDERPVMQSQIGRFSERLAEVIGDSVRGFANRCGLSEGTLRRYLDGGKAANARSVVYDRPSGRRFGRLARWRGH